MTSKIINTIQINIPSHSTEGYLFKNYENGQSLWSYKGLDFVYMTDTDLESDPIHSMMINITDSFPSGFSINSLADFDKWIAEDKEYRAMASMPQPKIIKG